MVQVFLESKLQCRGLQTQSIVCSRFGLISPNSYFVTTGAKLQKDVPEARLFGLKPRVFPELMSTNVGAESNSQENQQLKNYDRSQLLSSPTQFMLHPELWDSKLDQIATRLFYQIAISMPPSANPL